MTFNNFEKGLFSVLAFSSLVMLFNLISEALNASIVLFDFIYVYVFYFFALLVPLYMLVQWIRITSKERFLKFLISIIPWALFTLWFIVMVNALGENLNQF